MKFKILFALLATGSLLASLNAAPVQTVRAVPPAPPMPPARSMQSKTNAELLAWDSVMKEMTVKMGQAKAEFLFSVTNVSDTLVVIDQANGSCHCTTAEMPSKPWLIAPHTSGKLPVTVDLAGKFGTIYKTVTLSSTNAPKVLTVKVIIPENPEMVRSRNQELAKADRQAVLRGKCAECHVEKGRGKLGQELYVASCGICHDGEHRASTVPNLHALNHSTDYNYWKSWITTGKGGTMMPGFAKEQGGPLTEAEIASVAKYLSETVSANPQEVKIAQPVAK
ncbi:MAG: hypothetical protein JWQ71_3617 [Pedosphaera sp.]|nr:hypothetical protein [Pedosphaera sp.]